MIISRRRRRCTAPLLGVVIGVTMAARTGMARQQQVANLPSQLASADSTLTLAQQMSPAQQSPQQPESIYAPPAPPREDEGVNEGGVHLDLTVRYMTDYIYRGIDRSEVGGHEDSPNVQFDGLVHWDLGKLPHPFVGVFVNLYDSDPVSHFQEVRPTVGFDWPIKPLTVSAGNNTYVYPNFDTRTPTTGGNDPAFRDTNEVFTRIGMDDSFLWGTTRPVFSPYVYGAYDYDLNNGWYFEGGVKHDFVFEDTGLTLTAIADVAYVMGEQVFLLPNHGTSDTGFQHYDLGLIATYSLNTLLNVTRRYGEFSLQGYLYYTDGIDHDLRADTQLWGGVGINFRY